MLDERPNRRIGLSSTLIGVTALVVFAASCGTDRSGSAPQTSNATTGAPNAGGGDGTDVDSSAAETTIGRADFTHTIVAGDSLSSIASWYGVGVDDIVTVNGWSDGSGHLLLPGDVVYLPADAVDAEIVDAPAPSSASTGDLDAFAPDVECGANGIFGSHVLRPGETLDEVASDAGVDVDDLTDGRGYYGADIADATTGLVLYVPCFANWPANVSFFHGADVCPADGSKTAEYAVQPGDTPESVAAALGIDVDLLRSNRPDEASFMQSFDAGTIELCTSWFVAG